MHVSLVGIDNSPTFVGGTVGLLALNALFVLMKDYNLYVKYFTPLLFFYLLGLAGTTPLSTPASTPSLTATSCTSSTEPGFSA